MQFFPFAVRASFPCFTLALLVACPAARADTVYLKNGAYIDGLVTARGDTLLTITIGQIGKLEVSMDDVVRVEKNSRTGSHVHAPVLRRELPDVVRQKNESGGDPEAPVDVDADGDEERESEDSEESLEPSSDDQSSDPAEGDEDELDPELKAEIEQLVADLQRQKTRHRRRAERKLQRIGAPAVPFLLPLVTRGGDLTRITALRLISEHVSRQDPEIVEVCLKALQDDNYFVRDYAVKTLRKLTEQHFDFDAKANSRSRTRAALKWKKWWDEEKENIEGLEDGEDEDAAEEED